MGIDIDDAIQACNLRIAQDNPQFKCQPTDFYPQTPSNKVLMKGYWIAQYEVIYGQYHDCIQANGCLQYHTELALEDSYPFNMATRDEAAQYCKWRGGHLPNEQEWEYAVRGYEIFCILGVTILMVSLQIYVINNALSV
jgi:formylglycine-generating enzyme required for sulfatase activity